MTFALVGTAGTVATAGGGLAVTPAWGTGENRTANNDLVCLVVGFGSASLPAAPAGWSTGPQKPGTLVSVSIFYKVAAGGDAAPTIAAVTGVSLAVQLAEFSGNAISSVLDPNGSGSAAGTATPIVATNTGADARAGQLLVYCAAARYTASAAKTLANTLNNGASATSTANNNATSTTGNHWDLGFGITTGNSGADSSSFAFTTTNISGAAVAIASFQLFSVPLAPSAAAGSAATASLTALSLLTPSASAAAATDTAASAAALLSPSAASSSAAAGAVTAASLLAPSAAASSSASSSSTAAALVAPAATSASSATASARAASLVSPAAAAASSATATVTATAVQFLTPVAFSTTTAVASLTAATALSPTAGAASLAAGSVSVPARLLPTAASSSTATGALTAAAVLLPVSASTSTAAMFVLVPTVSLPRSDIETGRALAAVTGGREGFQTGGASARRSGRVGTPATGRSRGPSQ